jgi:glucosamine--fructose-6-phosphate aminotransferase (isomerizing)
VVVCLSQSGNTSEIVQTQAWAASCGAVTIAVTNHADSPLAAQADLVMVTRAGPELAVPATKSYTAQLVAMAVLATALADEPTALDPPLRRVPDEAARLLRLQTGIDPAVERLSAAERTLVSGRGIVVGTALELALKLEETCLRPVRGLSYADLRHGPIAFIDDCVAAVLVAAANGPMLAGMQQLGSDLRSCGATVVGIGGDQGLEAVCHTTVAGPDLPESVAPLVLAVPAQLVVEQLARRLGLNPDKPRGLRKVTETDRATMGLD